MPTWQGCLLFVLVGALLTVGIGRHLHACLSMNEVVPGGVMAVEGWGSDFLLREAFEEFNRGHYQKIYVTGGPLEEGALLSEYKTFAQRGAAVLVKLGAPTNLVQAVPAELVRADRTFASARAFRTWADKHNVVLQKVQVISEGPHARRSRLLFAKALGRNVEVGVTAVPVQDYDPDHWWRSSAGVRGVIAELLAYVYAKFFFWGSAG